MRVALVTGGAKRLGFELARALAQRGYAIALHYRSDPAEAARAAGVLRDAGARVETFRADLAVDGEPEALVASVLSSALLEPPGSPPTAPPGPCPRLDALVHAASPWIPRPFSSVTVADWEAVFRAGPRAAFFLAQAAAPALRAAQGSILFVSDVAAVKAWPTHVPHAAAKAAINALVLNLSVALAPDVRVNAVAPGVVLPPADMSPDDVARLVAKTPLKRPVAIGDLREMAVALLENRSMTGQVVAVDAGRTVRGD